MRRTRAADAQEVMMRGRIALFVALAVLTALGFYAGWTTSSPTAGADPSATPPTAAASKASTSKASKSNGSKPTASKPKAQTPQAPPDKGSPSKGTTPPGQQPPAPVTTQPPRPTGPVRFGKLTTAGQQSETNIAPDRRALTTTFDDFELVLENGEPAGSALTKSFSMTLPLTDGAAGETLRFHVQGYAFTGDGVRAQLTLRGGGRALVKGFGPGSDEDYLQTLELPATPGRTYQLSAVLELDAGTRTALDGYLNTLSIDIGID
jgi:hypothetical protein